MTSTQQFIEDSIKGGWDVRSIYINVLYVDGGKTKQKTTKQLAESVLFNKEHTAMLLDPLAWHAVGKTRCWDKAEEEKRDYAYEKLGASYTYVKKHRKNMHSFIDHLADGDSIEEALTKLL